MRNFILFLGIASWVGQALALSDPTQIPISLSLPQVNRIKQKPVEIKVPQLFPNPETDHLVRASLQLVEKAYKGKLLKVALKIENISDKSITIEVPSFENKVFVINLYDGHDQPYNYPNQFLIQDMLESTQKKKPSVTLEPQCYWGTNSFLSWQGVIIDQEGTFKIVAHIALNGSVEGKKVRGWIVKAEPLLVHVHPALQEKSRKKNTKATVSQ